MLHQFNSTQQEAKCIQMINRPRRGIRLKTFGRTKIICASEVIYLQALGNYTCIYMSNGKRLCYANSLKATLEKLGPCQFLRIHQSYAAHKNQVESIDRLPEGRICRLKNQQTLPVSRRRAREVMSLFKSVKQVEPKIITFSI